MRPLRRRVSDIVLARHALIPIGEHTAGVALPGPDVQFVEGWDAITVGGAHIVEQLAHPHRGRLMLGIPGVGDDHVLHTDESQFCPATSYNSASGCCASSSPSPT